jgi:hypothetical protein
MSVAVLEARALGRRLADALPPRAEGGAGGSDAAAARAAAARASSLPATTRAFMRGVGALVAVPWALATGTDAPYVKGFKRTRFETAINGMFEEVGRLGQDDVKVHATLMR